MISLEIAYRCESSQEKPWMEEKKNPNVPYLFFERTNGTVYIWFNEKGVEWVNTILKNKVKDDPKFLEVVKKKVIDGISWIRPLYENPRPLSRKDLLRFIDEFINTYNWVEALWWLCKVSEEELGTKNILVEVREQTDKLSAGTDAVIRQSLAQIYPKLGILSSMISIDEFYNDKIPDKDILQKRFDGFVYVDDGIHPELSRQEAIEKFSIDFVDEAPPTVTATIEGQSGAPGKVRGIVCKVMGHGDFGKIQAGQVLVSPMTMPDFLPVISKAGAIITDEGGITCHAAIVSRELKIPCIIGTKIATKVLKDGDLVEVDANKGVVRILKNK